MTKLIVEMEKVPKNCDDGCWGYLSGECPWSDHVDGYTMNGGRPRNCPILGVLPDEHGDLIDRDALFLKYKEQYDFIDEEDILNAEAVIAAEGKDDE